MTSWTLYLLFLIPPLIVGFAVQRWLRNTVAREMQVSVQSGLSGAQVARHILDRNGLSEVPVELAPGGPLSDHYDPRKRAVFLSQPVYEGQAVASTAIGAHEVGHALQHAQAWSFFRLRSAMWPAVAFASNAWIFILILGALLGALGLVWVAIILYAVVVLFQLVTLPVELDASRRAMAQIQSLGLVTEPERDGAGQVLKAAAMTYVAGALAALTQLAYFVMVYAGGRN